MRAGFGMRTGYIMDYSLAVISHCAMPGGNAGCSLALLLKVHEKKGFEEQPAEAYTFMCEVWYPCYHMEFVEKHGGVRPAHMMVVIARDSGLDCPSTKFDWISPVMFPGETAQFLEDWPEPSWMGRFADWCRRIFYEDDSHRSFNL